MSDTEAPGDPAVRAQERPLSRHATNLRIEPKLLVESERKSRLDGGLVFAVPSDGDHPGVIVRGERRALADYANGDFEAGISGGGQ